jgi:hypothetical protein
MIKIWAYESRVKKPLVRCRAAQAQVCKFEDMKSGKIKFTKIK